MLNGAGLVMAEALRRSSSATMGCDEGRSSAKSKGQLDEKSNNREFSKPMQCVWDVPRYAPVTPDLRNSHLSVANY